MCTLTDGERDIHHEQDADAAYDLITGPLDEAELEAEQERAREEHWAECDQQREVAAFERRVAVNERTRTLADNDAVPF